MIKIEVEPNPNCRENAEFVFSLLGAPRPIRGVRVGKTGEETDCELTGVDAGGVWVEARAVKVTDSGAGYAYLIYGGGWGIRLKPGSHAEEPWDLSNPRQWGEPFKLYGSADDILYSES